MINTANTLGASAPGFNRSNLLERKPDVGLHEAEAKPKDNLQSVRQLDGGQAPSENRQVVRNQVIPSVNPADRSDNETRRNLDQTTAYRATSAQTAAGSAAGQTNSSQASTVSQSSPNPEEAARAPAPAEAEVQARNQTPSRQENRDSERREQSNVSISEQGIARAQERAAVRDQALETKSVDNSRADAQDRDRALIPQSEQTDFIESSTQSNSVSESRANEVEDESAEASGAGASNYTQFAATQNQPSDILPPPARENQSESSNNRSSSSFDATSLSRAEQEGLRSFQNNADVNAFESTGTTIDVAV